jgi:hypothetical protein
MERGAVVTATEKRISIAANVLIILAALVATVHLFIEAMLAPLA